MTHPSIVEHGVKVARTGTAREAAGQQSQSRNERSVIFARARRLLTNTFYCCIQTARANTDIFDLLATAHYCKNGQSAGSGVNRRGILGQLSQWFERGQNFAAQSISISRG